MYSPYQEVPSTPTLVMRANVLTFGGSTPEAIVPDDFIDQSQGQSFSVPGTPLAPTEPSSLGTPRARSQTRSMTQARRRYLYNPSITPRFVPMSPIGYQSPREQVVPCTPVGGFVLPSTPTSRSSLVPKRRRPLGTPDLTQELLRVTDLTDQDNNMIAITCAIDATGDNPRQLKRNKLKDEEQRDGNNTPSLMPRCERESIAMYRRSPEARPGFENHGVSQDFLDTI